MTYAVSPAGDHPIISEVVRHAVWLKIRYLTPAGRRATSSYGENAINDRSGASKRRLPINRYGN